jgi:hypothetical protein
MDNKQKHMLRVFTEMLDDTGARLQHIPLKSLNRPSQETGASRSCA